MADQPTLRELQDWMSWVITDPRGVEDALAAPPPRKAQRRAPKALAPQAMLEAIAAQPPISRVQRLDVYAEAYFERLVECLVDDFPTLARVLGEELFRRLVSAFLEAHPSRSFTAATLGAALPRFLADYELSRELPYLPELAAFEWAFVSAFFAKEHPLLDPSKLAGLKESEWPNVVLTLDLSVSLIDAQWNIDEMQRDAAQPAEPSPRALVVWRAGVVSAAACDVQSLKISALELHTLELMRSGKRLGEICDALEARLDIDAELPPLMDWFKLWVERGVIRDARLSARRAR